MKIKGFLMFAVVLLFAIVIAWIAITVYDSVKNIEVNPNAASYRQPIQSDFDTAGLIKVNERVEVLYVSPDILHQLEDNGIDQKVDEIDEETN